MRVTFFYMYTPEYPSMKCGGLKMQVMLIASHHMYHVTISK